MSLEQKIQTLKEALESLTGDPEKWLTIIQVPVTRLYNLCQPVDLVPQVGKEFNYMLRSICGTILSIIF